MCAEPRAQPVSVLVVDDHAYFREVLRDVVAATPGMTLAGEAATGEEAVDAVAALAPRLVIMDKRMQGIGGVEAARRITAQHPGIVVVLVSVEEPRDSVLAASGAAAFLHKRKLSPAALTELWEKYGRPAERP
jgi:two-component system, NarL family, invasion response regulator UvrY